jgi:hypothetical protein
MSRPFGAGYLRLDTFPHHVLRLLVLHRAAAIGPRQGDVNAIATVDANELKKLIHAGGVPNAALRIAGRLPARQLSADGTDGSRRVPDFSTE